MSEEWKRITEFILDLRKIDYQFILDSLSMSNSSSVLYWHNFRRAKLSSSLTSFSSSVQTAYSAFLNVDAFSMLAKTPSPPMWTPTHPPLYPPCTLDDSPGDQLDPISSQLRWATKKNQSPQYPAGLMVRKGGLERGRGWCLCLEETGSHRISFPFPQTHKAICRC